MIFTVRNTKPTDKLSAREIIVACEDQTEASLVAGMINSKKVPPEFREKDIVFDGLWDLFRVFGWTAPKASVHPETANEVIIAHA